MKKILFLHGFFATGSCPMAIALKEAFENHATVLTPDLPLHPKEALKQARSIIDRPAAGQQLRIFSCTDAYPDSRHPGIAWQSAL